MTLEDIEVNTMENNTSRKTVSKTLTSLLRRAQLEKRLTCALLPAIKMLERDPTRAMFCILPQSRQGDAALHIHSVLLQAFCYENNIYIIKVDSADKLGAIVGSSGQCSCVLVHRPWATDQMSASETELARFCGRNTDTFPPTVVQLPGS